MVIREERKGDHDAVRLVITEAFKYHPHSNQREHFLVDALRDAGALTVALVAEEDGEIVGHIAFSPIQIEGRFQDWYGLGPVAVHPDRQGAGIGQTLVREGLWRLANLHAAGCVLLGEPAYYGRFGFAMHPQLRLEGVSSEYFMALAFGNTLPSGAVMYHGAFSEVA